MEGRKKARAVRNEPFIYPCFFVGLELSFAALFYSFWTNNQPLIIFLTCRGSCGLVERKRRKNSLELNGWTEAAMSGERHERNGLQSERPSHRREERTEVASRQRVEQGWCKGSPQERGRFAAMCGA